MAVSVRVMNTRKGERMARFQLEDLEGQVEIVVFPKLYPKCASLLEEEAILVVKGRKDSGGDDASILASSIEPLSSTAAPPAVPAATSDLESPTHTVEIDLDLGNVDHTMATALRAVLERYRGPIPVVLKIRGRENGSSFRARISPNRYLFVDPSSELVDELEELLGSDAIRLRS